MSGAAVAALAMADAAGSNAALSCWALIGRRILRRSPLPPSGMIIGNDLQYAINNKLNAHTHQQKTHQP